MQLTYFYFIPLRFFFFFVFSSTSNVWQFVCGHPNRSNANVCAPGIIYCTVAVSWVTPIALYAHKLFHRFIFPLAVVFFRWKVFIIRNIRGWNTCIRNCLYYYIIIAKTITQLMISIDCCCNNYHHEEEETLKITRTKSEMMDSLLRGVCVMKIVFISAMNFAFLVSVWRIIAWSDKNCNFECGLLMIEAIVINDGWAETMGSQTQLS